MAITTIPAASGSGPGVTVDSCGGDGDAQVIKAAFGTAGTLTLVTAAAPMPVTDISAKGTAWTKTSVSSSATSVQLLAANASRKGVRIRNSDANPLYLSYGAAAATDTNVIKLVTDAIWIDFPASDGLAIQGIWGADGSGAALIEELA